MNIDCYAVKHPGNGKYMVFDVLKDAQKEADGLGSTVVCCTAKEKGSIAQLEAKLAEANRDIERLEYLAQGDGLFVWSTPMESDGTDIRYCVCDIVDMGPGGEITGFHPDWRDAIDEAIAKQGGEG